MAVIVDDVANYYPAYSDLSPWAAHFGTSGHPFFRIGRGPITHSGAAPIHPSLQYYEYVNSRILDF